MKYSRSDLQEILILDEAKVFELLAKCKLMHTYYHGGDMITFDGYTVFDGDTYQVRMYTHYSDKNGVLHCISIDGIEHIFKTRKEYIYMVHYLVKQNEVNHLVEARDAEENKKGFWSRFFGA